MLGNVLMHQCAPPMPQPHPNPNPALLNDPPCLLRQKILLNLWQYMKYRYPLPMRYNLHVGISAEMNRNRNAGRVAMV